MKRAWRVEQAAAFLDVTTRTLYKWLKRSDAPPHMRIAGKRPTLRFDQDALKRWLEEGNHGDLSTK